MCLLHGFYRLLPPLTPHLHPSPTHPPHTQVMPEVAAKEAEEAAAREAARLAAAKALAEGKGPVLPSVLEESDEEEQPDLEYQVRGSGPVWVHKGYCL